jgi:lipid II:glycine glycyltransferase (peptidoglycan interpeptide bridge formation enzyme)
MGFVVTAIHSDRPIAAAVFFRLGRKSLFKFGASDSSFQSMRANNLVMWEGIKYLSKEGCDNLHLGRTSGANQGLRHFKLGWGAEERPIAYTEFNLRQSTFVRRTDRAYGWHNCLFRVAPSWMARLVGAIFYGRLA